MMKVGDDLIVSVYGDDAYGLIKTGDKSKCKLGTGDEVPFKPDDATVSYSFKLYSVSVHVSVETNHDSLQIDRLQFYHLKYTCYFALVLLHFNHS